MYCSIWCFILGPCKRRTTEVRRGSWKGSAVQRGLEPGSKGIAIARSQYQAMEKT
jgi:hypothetical protein